MISNKRYIVGFLAGFVAVVMWVFSGITLAETLSQTQDHAHGQVQAHEQLNSQGKWRILIVAEADNLGLRAGHSAYKRVNNAIFTQLQRAGFDVLSLAADKTLPLCLMDVCKQRTEQDIIALANASASDIDLVILFSVRYIERVGAGIIHREISVPSRMIDVKTGRRVGLWDDDGVLTEPIPEACVDRCLQSALSDYARQIGRDSGLAIAIKLQEYQRWFDYQLTFLKFAKGELLAFEQYFKNNFKSNVVRRIDNKVDKESSNQVLFHTIVNRKIVIESLLSPPTFRQRLQSVLDDEGLSANIQTNGYAFILHREGLPYAWRYTFMVIFLLVLLVVSYFRVVRYQHNKVLAQLARMKQTLMDQTLANPIDENPYPLLMNVELLLNCVSRGTKIQQQKNDVRVARDAFIKALPVLTGRSSIKSERLTATVNVLVDDSVQIGRYRTDSHVENRDDNIAIGFTRLSHVGKQNKIERHHDGFTLVDEGSTNGSFLDDALTVVDQPVSLTVSEHVLCLGGSRDPLEPGVCQLRLYAKNVKGSSLIIEIDSAAIALADQSKLNKNWPNLAYDQTQQWLLLGAALEIGVDVSGNLDIGCLRDSKTLAILSYFHHSHSYQTHPETHPETHPKTTAPEGRCPGYWLEPVAVEGGASIDISVNQTPIFTAVPLIQGANVSIAGIAFSLMSVTSKKPL